MKAKILSLCILFLSQSFLNPIFGKETITWMTNEFAPAWIHEGKYKGQGGEDLLMDLFAEQLPHYRHERLIANISRSYRMMKKKENVCGSGMFKTQDREKFMHYSSVPSAFITSNGIIIQKGHRSQFGQDDPVFMKKLIKNAHLSLGIEQDRKYGGQIDSILDAYRNKKWVYQRSAIRTTKGLVEMLLRGRIDYLIAYDWELQYLIKQHWPQEEKNVSFLPIVETPPNLVSYAVCSKTPWGKKVIEQINQIILKNRNTERYQNFWMRWLSNRELYQKLYHEKFLKMQPNSSVIP